MELIGESEPVAATIAVHRRRIASQDDLDALEDEAVAEAIAAYQGAEGEGTADVAVYTQVLDDETGDRAVAVVMAVAAAADGGLEIVGDEPGEAAVMVTDAIASDDELAALEAEAVEEAVEALYEEMDAAEEDIDLTLYTGVADESEDGQTYAAVVAIAARVSQRPEMAPEPPADRAPRPQDLERVEGIGPKIAELLIAHNILDLDDLAVASVAHLRDVLAGAGKRFRLADPASWPEQAALGVKGLWDDLAALQNRLKGGR
jgi:predicted flap endonuclease-1-like 5' DNA nuclease